VSTAVLYCTVPEVGGATVFSKADIYAKPVKNAVTFFVYKGKDGNMDNGFTEHSGCPVLEGEKWISVAWMREGVTRERDWTMIDPSGKDVL
jgi:prolyl 4-hydroxylase